MTRKTACIVLAAGRSTRMKSATPKPLHKIAGRTMIGHVLAAAEGLAPEKIIVIVGQGMDALAQAVRPHGTAVQAVPNGTGGAALAAAEQLKGFDGDILIIFGDHPLFTTATMQKMIDARRQSASTGLVYSAMRLDDPARYGRMIMDEDGTLKKIVEFKDATEAEKKINLCNGGLICADGARLFDWLQQVGNDNAQKEYYLTDLPAIARKDNRVTLVVEIDPAEMEAANTREELARLEKLMQQRLRRMHMENGVTLTDPDSVFFSHDTQIAQDVTIGPNVVFGTGVTVHDNVDILPFCHIDGAIIHSGAQIGPFARIRPGTVVGEKAKIGNFVETKNTALGKGAKISHLAYAGDAEIGDKSNIGAGTIFCNYDGFDKHRSTVGTGAFVGSNTTLVSPVTIGDGALIAAGSTITKDVPADALAASRTPQTVRDGGAAAFRARKSKKKE